MNIVILGIVNIGLVYDICVCFPAIVVNLTVANFFRSDFLCNVHKEQILI